MLGPKTRRPMKSMKTIEDLYLIYEYLWIVCHILFYSFIWKQLGHNAVTLTLRRGTPNSTVIVENWWQNFGYTCADTTKVWQFVRWFVWRHGCQRESGKRCQTKTEKETTREIKCIRFRSVFANAALFWFWLILLFVWNFEKIYDFLGRPALPPTNFMNPFQCSPVCWSHGSCKKRGQEKFGCKPISFCGASDAKATVQNHPKSIKIKIE